MTRKEYLLSLLVIASITLSFFFGYFVFRLEEVKRCNEPVKVIPEINPKVCTVDLEIVGGKFLSGKVGEKQVRLRFLDEVLLLGNGGEFKFELGD